ncbi:uncharacterized protein N0V89_001049 [Didymosphaeria variabile]|uniref:Fatty acid desaturase domain-containing protein n=1 Tax=Didymosphaeria variabile TaxID=1932322 RepID=A0A9W9CG98_9PLEO|nr:uncharacterized protein N0V89_001049 [Didymosphaeria variabile]KAJ4360484.1 hypothetical protein N0V89_001049 [Didymosphaeria variabile]
MGVTATATHVRAPSVPIVVSAVPDVKTLKNAIPSKCFERSLVRSLSYVARDLVFVSLLVSSAVYLTKLDAPVYISIPLWGLYSFVQGLFFTGLWILAHECGHDSFSPYLKVNATMGWILHSILLVPFFSWKFSHARHHRYHNHMAKDTVFVPSTKEEFEANQAKGLGLLAKLVDHTAADTPIMTLAALVVHQVFGWPMYMFLNAGAGYESLVKGSRKTTKKYKQSHYDPRANIFTDAEAPFIAISDLGLLIVLGALYMVSRSLGVGNTLLLYGLPYLWMNHWIVAITYLHHTHEKAPHYDADSWTFVQGAMSTVDREFGFIGKHIFHGIVEYHVVHHLFPRIPFYHAEEATEAIRSLLGDKYIEQRTNFMADLWTAFTTCKYVEQGTKKGQLVWAAPAKTK